MKKGEKDARIILLKATRVCLCLRCVKLVHDPCLGNPNNKKKVSGQLSAKADASEAPDSGCLGNVIKLWHAKFNLLHIRITSTYTSTHLHLNSNGNSDWGQGVLEDQNDVLRSSSDTEA